MNSIISTPFQITSQDLNCFDFDCCQMDQNIFSFGDVIQYHQNSFSSLPEQRSSFSNINVMLPPPLSCNQTLNNIQSNNQLNDQPWHVNNSIEYTEKYDQQLLDSSNQQFDQMSPSNCSSSSNEITTRQKFTKEEDEKLKKLVNIYGAKKWSRIASMIPGRTPRQCRDRYSNYLIPGVNSTEWSINEDRLLAEKFSEYGSQWTLISRFLQGRTPNSIKNRWKYNVSRRVSSLLSISKTQNQKKTEKNEILISNDHLVGEINKNQNLISSLNLSKESQNNPLPQNNKANKNEGISSDAKHYFSTNRENYFNSNSNNSIQNNISSHHSNITDKNSSFVKGTVLNKNDIEKEQTFNRNSDVLVEFENQCDDESWAFEYFGDDEELLNNISI